MAKLIEILRAQNSQPKKTIVFVKNALETKYIGNYLVDNNFPATSIGRFFSNSNFFLIKFHLVIRAQKYALENWEDFVDTNFWFWLRRMSPV